MTEVPAPPPSSLRLRLDADALRANWLALDGLSGRAAAGAAVKADAYGVGAARVVQTLADAGCRTFFVAHWAEVADLLPLIPAEQIAVLHGPMNDAEVAYAKAIGVRPVINTLAQARRWREADGGTCHVMVDTGINRLGLGVGELGDPVLCGLDIDICMSHLASADEDVAQNEVQRARFHAVRDQLRAKRYSLANSAGIALGEAYHADLTRPGLALYGGVARPELAGCIAQVAFPEAALIQVRDLREGDLIGYNATFTAQRAMRVGVLAIGYADGYLRCWSGKGRFKWLDREVPVVGRVSMDLTIVDLSNVPDCQEGDWLRVLYDLPRAARVSGLSQYELLTLMGRRFARAGAI